MSRELVTELEQLQRETYDANAKLADHVLELLDKHGLGHIVRWRFGAAGNQATTATISAPKVTGGRRASEPATTQKRAAKVCSVPDCMRPHLAHGLCCGHNHRREKGVSLTDPPLRAFRARSKTGSAATRERAPCAERGCDRPSHGQGLCGPHYQAARRAKRSNPMPRPTNDDEDAPVITAEDLAPLPDDEPKGRRVSRWHSLNGGTPKFLTADTELLVGQSKGELGNPRPLANGFRAIKKIECGAYDGCLDYAARQRWKSWTCAGCKGPGIQTAPNGLRVAR